MAGLNLKNDASEICSLDVRLWVWDLAVFDADSRGIGWEVLRDDRTVKSDGKINLNMMLQST